VKKLFRWKNAKRPQTRIEKACGSLETSLFDDPYHNFKIVIFHYALNIWLPKLFINY